MKTFLAVFTCAENSECHLAWKRLSPDEQKLRLAKGSKALQDWWAKYRNQVTFDGGHLADQTLKIDKNGIRPVPSQMGSFLVVKSTSLEEASKIFFEHPHYRYFPGDGVDIIEMSDVPRVSIE